MNAIENMEKNGNDFRGYAKRMVGELLPIKEEIDKHLRDKNIGMLQLALKKMLKLTEEIKECNDTAYIWEQAAAFAIKERDAVKPEQVISFGLKLENGVVSIRQIEAAE